MFCKSFKHSVAGKNYREVRRKAFILRSIVIYEWLKFVIVNIWKTL